MFIRNNENYCDYVMFLHLKKLVNVKEIENVMNEQFQKNLTLKFAYF